MDSPALDAIAAKTESSQWGAPIGLIRSSIRELMVLVQEVPTLPFFIVMVRGSVNTDANIPIPQRLYAASIPFVRWLEVLGKGCTMEGFSPRFPIIYDAVVFADKDSMETLASAIRSMSENGPSFESLKILYSFLPQTSDKDFYVESCLLPASNAARVLGRPSHASTRTILTYDICDQHRGQPSGLTLGPLMVPERDTDFLWTGVSSLVLPLASLMWSGWLIHEAKQVNARLSEVRSDILEKQDGIVVGLTTTERTMILHEELVEAAVKLGSLSMDLATVTREVLRPFVESSFAETQVVTSDPLAHGEEYIPGILFKLKRETSKVSNRAMETVEGIESQLATLLNYTNTRISGELAVAMEKSARRNVTLSYVMAFLAAATLVTALLLSRPN